MAEMDTSSGGGHKKGPGVKKSKKLSTRVDLTPMVDLGFLLITFFIFTTTMSQPTAMPLNLPKDVQDPNDQNKVKESAVLTIMLGKDNHVYYYEGMDPTKIQSSTFKAIRDVVIDKKRRTDPNDFVVILKPTQDATYGDVVNIVDEMKIDDVKRFAQVDISPVEYSLIQKTEAANGAH
ncbi:MAG TPA: biopolymer transporter ExbD [Puia sp.]|nr:biopolymer transporter ExbD [Puia sp.]